MSTIAENLLALQTAKENIKTAIEGKGQDLTDVPFTQYHEKILAIQTGGGVDKLQYKCDNIQSLAYEFYKSSQDVVTPDEAVIEMMRGVDTSKVKNMKYMFSADSGKTRQTIKDLSEITIDATSCQSMENMFAHSPYLKKIPKIINIPNNCVIEYMFRGCGELETPLEMDTSNVERFAYLYYGCLALKTTYNYDVSNATSLSSMYYNCNALESEIEMTLGRDNVNMASAFWGCKKVPKITIHSDKGGDWSNAFRDCLELTDLRADLRNATRISYMFGQNYNLTNLYLKNIKLTLQIADAQSGKLLTLDSLLNTFKELWNMTGSTTQTLTIGSPNLEKIANIYVKLIDITDEMRAEDEYIDNKLPFVQCESTDEGAMTIQEYVTSKNWQLA